MTIENTRPSQSRLAPADYRPPPHIVPEADPHSPAAVLKALAAATGAASNGGGGDADGDEQDHLPEAMIGTVLAGKHRIICEIGCGGTGRVYKAEHCLLQRLEAVKVLHKNLCADGESLQRFQVEARATSTLRHENLIAVTDFGITEAKQPYLVMDYIEGESLADFVKRHGRLNAKQFVDIFSQICRGLDHAHQKGIIHRDLKPSNIMISQTAGGKTLVRILDFGTAKILHTDLSAPQHLTHTGEIFGSPLYMSPEQCRGAQVDCRSDIYSIGCVMFEALTGEPPIQSANLIEILYKHLSGSAPTLSEAFPELKIPFALENIVSKAMAPDVQQRYATSAELEKDLASAQILLDSGKKVALRRPGRAAPAKLFPKLTLPLIAALLLGLGVFANFPKLAGSLNITQATSAANKASQLAQAKLMSQAADEKEEQDPGAAYQYAKSALAIRAALAPNSPEHAFSLDQVGNIACHRNFKGKESYHAFQTEAEACLKKAVDMAPVVPGDTDSGKLQYMRDLARFYLFDDIHKSAALLAEVSKTAGLTDDQLVYPKNGTFMYDLQNLYVRQGNYVAAAKLELKRDLGRRTTKEQMQVPASPDFAGDWKVYEPDTVGIDGNNLHLRICAGSEERADGAANKNCGGSEGRADGTTKNKNTASQRLKIDIEATGTAETVSDPNAAGHLDNAAVAQVVWKVQSKWTTFDPNAKAAIVRIGKFLVWFIPDNLHPTDYPSCCVLTRNESEVK